MKKLALLLLTSQAHATGCLEWIPDIRTWLYAGPAGKYNTLDLQESYINTGMTRERDFSRIHFKSVGVQLGGGFVFPIPFFLGVDGSYTKLYSSRYEQKSVINEMTSYLPSLEIEGDFWTYEFKLGYAFTPFCGWSISPLIAYNTDKIPTTFPSFPFVIPPNMELREYHLKNRTTFTGPALGFGTSLQLPWGFLLSGEAFWQWRQLLSTGRNNLLVAQPGVSLMSSKQHTGFSTWVQGPRIDLNLDYCFGNWFAGLNGEWQYLSQFTSSYGNQGETDVTVDIHSHNVIHISRHDSPLKVHNARWQSWVWMGYLGFFF